MEFLKPPRDTDTSHLDQTETALRFCLKHLGEYGLSRNAIDAGGHIGKATRIMADQFNHVYTFEPLWGQYLRQNIMDKSNVTVHDVGLGNTAKMEKIYIMPTNTGGSSIVEHKRREKFQKQSWTETKKIIIKKIDSYNLHQVDFIKIDVESYEQPVILGGEKTIKRDKPLLMIEMMERYENENIGTVKRTAEIIESWGYNLIETFGDDRIYGYG